MEQSKLESAIEAFVNNGSGFLIALTMWACVVGPLIKAGVLSVDNNVIITTIFFMVSYLRSFFWRRFFATGVHRSIHKFIGRVLNGRRSTQRR